MRILIISPWCDDIDLETCKGTPESAYLLKALLEKGHEVTYICQGSEEQIPSNIKHQQHLKIIPIHPFILLKPAKINYLLNPFRLKKYGEYLGGIIEHYLVALRYQVIYNIGCYGHLVLRELSRRYHIPYAIKTMGTIHFEEIREKAYRKYQYYKEHIAFSVQADHYLLVDDGTKTYAVAKYYGIPDSNITLLPNPKPAQLIPEIRKTTKPVIGYFSRFDKLKGTDLFCRIAKAVLKSFSSPRFIIAGDGPMRPHIENLKKMFPERVEYLGFLEHRKLIQYYSQIHILVSTNRYSNLTLPVIEALSSGIPVIAFNTQETGKLLKHNFNSLLVKPFEVRDFVKSILDLCQHDELLERLSKGAIETGQSIPTWEERINKEVSKLEELAGEVL
ncbi:MAG: glycosyltransferase family 4 protein [candidate division WOR-3 bacterium]